MTLVKFYITGINIQNKQCFITLHEILEAEKIRGIKEKIKASVPPQILKYVSTVKEENFGQQYNIYTTPEEYKAKKLEIGQIVKLNIPTKIADILVNNDV